MAHELYLTLSDGQLKAVEKIMIDYALGCGGDAIRWLLDRFVEVQDGRPIKQPPQKSKKPVDRFILVDLTAVWVSEIKYSITEIEKLAEEVSVDRKPFAGGFALAKIIGTVNVESKLIGKANLE